ncbi:MAG: hypothetical protein MZV64_10465 [Ignavibacteriales bacterium]|nr:hypothetical protein [Ignavibacteriales bacterium]
MSGRQTGGVQLTWWPKRRQCPRRDVLLGRREQGLASRQRPPGVEGPRVHGGRRKRGLSLRGQLRRAGHQGKSLVLRFLRYPGYRRLAAEWNLGQDLARLRICPHGFPDHADHAAQSVL